MRFARLALCGGVLLFAAALYASIFGSIRGLVHDPQHRPIQGAEVVLQSGSSGWTQSAASDGQGEFQFNAVPLGIYEITVRAPGFAALQQKAVVNSGSVLNVHFQLAVGSVSQTINVSAGAEEVNPGSSSSTTIVTRQQIARSPGADQTNSTAMITDYVPGAYVIHDQLHIRGGHQVTWLVDGVPVPNTNIASNVGPQFDPKDIDSLEVQRGGYSAEYGDRTYGVFNVVTRSGFERAREGELVASYGSLNTTNDQISLGSHSERFAYYASLSGNRTDLGLETPVSRVLHDQASGIGGFVSLIFNRTPSDQLRLIASVRGDHYQVPNTLQQQADGTRDVEQERDAFVNFSWVHSTARGLMLTVSPFYHFNRAHYVGGPGDTPVSAEHDRGSNYAGGVVTLAVVKGKHNARIGMQAFVQHDNTFLALNDTTGESPSVRQSAITWGTLGDIFLEDQYRATSWLTVNGGVRLTRFSGPLTETAADPRVGAAIRVPRLGWVIRGFYGRYYQAPPLLTVSGPLLEVAAQQGFGFLPLRGERDEQHEIGLTIPISGWVVEVTHFRTSAKNFFDHDALGNSNIFFPVTLERARIRGWEATLRTPKLAGRAQFHLAYSHQFTQGRGAVTGGLTDFEPPENGDYFFLDHDQRDTLSTVVTLDLPWRSWAATTVSYGSGFLDGDGPAHLPPHTTVDLSLGKRFGERWSVQLTGLNVGNQRYLLDNSNSFGGTHYADPRRVSIQVRYRFHY